MRLNALSVTKLAWFGTSERDKERARSARPKRTCRTVGRPPRRFKSTGLFCQRGTGVCDLLSQLVRSVGDRPEGRRIVE